MSVKVAVAMRLVAVAMLLLAAGCANHHAKVQVPAADPSQDHLFDVARGAFDAAEYDHAAHFYELARERARLRDDGPAIAAAAYNLAAARLRLGDLDGADAALGEARTALVDTPDAAKLDVLLLSAEVAYRRGDPKSALAIAEQALAAAGAAPPIAAQLRLLTGQLACDGGESAAARGALDAATAAADLPAHARVEACIALLNGDAGTAGAAFDREARAQREKRDYRAMSEALGRAGDAYARAGDTRAAADRLLRAGRSAVRQGAVERARQWLNGARDFASASGDTALRAAAAAELQHLEQSGIAR